MRSLQYLMNNLGFYIENTDQTIQRSEYVLDSCLPFINSVYLEDSYAINFEDVKIVLQALNKLKTASIILSYRLQLLPTKDECSDTERHGELLVNDGFIDQLGYWSQIKNIETGEHEEKEIYYIKDFSHEFICYFPHNTTKQEKINKLYDCIKMNIEGIFIEIYERYCK